MYSGNTSDDEYNTRYMLSYTAGNTLVDIICTCSVVGIKIDMSLTKRRLYMGGYLLDIKPKASFTACHLEPIATCFINNNISSEAGSDLCVFSVLQHGQ